MPNALKFTSVLVASLLAATLVSSCGGKDTHEKIMEDTLSLMDKVVSAVEGVEDQKSAEAAAKKLDDMVGDFEKIADRMEVIGEPDEKTEKTLKEDYEKRGEELMQKMMSSMLSVASKGPEIMKTLQEPMEKIGKAMEKVK